MASRRAPARPLLRLLSHRSKAAAASPADPGFAPALPQSLPQSLAGSKLRGDGILPFSGTFPRPGPFTGITPSGLIPGTESNDFFSGARGVAATATATSASASKSVSASTTSGASGPALVELRTYNARPDSLRKYLQLTGDAAPLRKELCPGWMGFWTTETGGNLGEVKHLYRYEGWEEREAARAAMQANKEWSADYLPQIRPLLVAQHSMMLVEAQDCLEAIARAAEEQSPDPAGTQAATGEGGGAPVFEWRRYELVPGYHSMPTLKKHMLHGLPFRVAAQRRGKCVFMGHSEVGLLNVFVELWRYDSTAQCTQARRAARTSKEWQASIAGIAEVTQNFTSKYLRATSFSPAK